jgi:hypothetical protein
VDPEVRRLRLLTGADFDLESFREAFDGTLWFGDEFGPFLLRTDRKGRLLEAPIPLPGVRSPENPQLAGAAPNLPPSRGFEGMAITADGRTLYPMLEGALTTDPDRRRLVIHQFDLRTHRYSDQRWYYRLEADPEAGQSIGDLTAVTDRRFLVVERDHRAGAATGFAQVFLVDLGEVDDEGFLVKRRVADLMDLDDPHDLAGHGRRFRAPFRTVESVIPLGENRLAVVNDNGAAGRGGAPDPTEFIVIRLDRALAGLGMAHPWGNDEESD